ncbi:helix-turn-helix domain-containing protein [Actinacidiphila rubida]|uniref:DNA binding domain-containing protein, excisionase family n=1 Tax=Actinacidiphila rubida TaxID=310780 RepID=A0A1H8TUZ8_9ACTN|nr:helix-turn-helix domain-containing protein [Actinacidiphila rubida]SEO94850.1 DNA binding domain-containing protein, excisionase family [Actinacidiphila rubida]
MRSNDLPVAQIALLLGVPEQDLRALVAARDSSPGDPTLVALTVVEAARRIGIGRTKMYEYVSSGQIPSVKIGSLRRIPAEALAVFVAQQNGDASNFTTAA